VPVLWLTASTIALPIAAAAGSVIAPVMVPYVDCAGSVAEHNAAAAANVIVRISFKNHPPDLIWYVEQ